MEVLHVVLLGFVKYFWCDAIGRLSVANKALLTLRISSLNTTGLGFPHLTGKTYVQFASSLVGRDFRVIAQITPFVLFDLLPEYLYDTWLTLCVLIGGACSPIVDAGTQTRNVRPPRVRNHRESVTTAVGQDFLGERSSPSARR